MRGGWGQWVVGTTLATVSGGIPVALMLNYEFSATKPSWPFLAIFIVASIACGGAAATILRRA